MPNAKLKSAFPILVALTLLMPCLASAHGFVGKRFFPVTLTFRDPIANEEFDTLFNHTDNVGRYGEARNVNNVEVYYSKRITPKVALSIGTSYDNINPHFGSSQHGFRSLNIAGKFIGHIDPESEFVWSYGVNAVLNGFGSVGPNYNVYTPTFYFGKGFGNVSGMKALRPFAVTGALGVDIPSHADVSHNLVSDFSLQYNNTYPESFMQRPGVPSFLKNSIFLVELPVTTCLDQSCRGQATATINPGIALVNFAGQIALEGTLPVNSHTGNSVGVLVQAHLYLDNLFPDSIGKPFFH